MAVDGEAALVSALSSGDFGAVEGTREGAWVDFKRDAYALDAQAQRRLSKKGKWELCKDVAALANDGGGCIVIGFEEEMSPEHGVAVAGSVRPILKSAVDIASYKDVLESGVYPVVRDVEFIWYNVDDPARGVFLIRVRGSDRRPHILRRMIDDDGKEIKALAIPRRNDDRTEWETAESLYHKLTSNSSKPSGHEEGWNPNLVSDRAPKETKRRAAQAIERIISAESWEDGPVLTIQAVPSGAISNLSNFYDEVREALRRPDSIRPMGFGLASVSHNVEVIEGNLVVDSARDTAVRLDRDGLFTVCMLASDSFLGWGVNQRQDATNATVLNSIVVVEFTYELVRFVYNVLEAHGLKGWSYVLDVRNFKTENIVLPPHRPSSMFGLEERRIATSDNWHHEVARSTGPEKDSYELLVELYALFGHSPKVIPFVANNIVDVKQLRDVGALG